MLLLGTGGAGKSTIFKQLKILNQTGFSQEDRLDFKQIIYSNILGAIKDICQACQTLGIMYGTEENHKRALLLLTLNPKLDSPIFFQDEIEILWRDPGIKVAMTRTNEFNLIESASYFLGQSLARVCNPDYVPSDQDILRCRKRTNGVSLMEFKQDQTSIQIFDVGGQRGERKKWIRCFDNVTSIIYVASLSEFDQELREAKGVNRMQESLNLFQAITGLPWFRQTAVILFLNKSDLLADKLKTSDLRTCFPEYSGSSDYDQASSYIRQQYEQRKGCSNSNFYVHFTCATDTSNIKFVMRATVDIIMKRCLELYGLAGGS